MNLKQRKYRSQPCPYCQQSVEISPQNRDSSDSQRYICPHCQRSSLLYLSGDELGKMFVLSMICGFGFSHFVKQITDKSLLVSSLLVVVIVLLGRKIEDYWRLKRGTFL